MGRPIVHFELWSPDPTRLVEFYRRVFDWDIRNIPGANYNFVEAGSSAGITGGIMKAQPEPWPGNMALYIDVEDLDEMEEKIREAGGMIVIHKVPVPNVGLLTLFKDPDGRVLGMWKRRDAAP